MSRGSGFEFEDFLDALTGRPRGNQALQSAVAGKDAEFFRALLLRIGEVANLTGEPARTVLERAVANHVAAVKLSYLRNGHVLFVEGDGTSKRLKLPRRPA